MLSTPLQSVNLLEMGQYLRKVKWDKEDLEHAKKFINQISFLSEENFMGHDSKGFEELEYIMSNNEKIFVPAFGQYSSGKSTLLNILIGKDYLPTSDGVCTNKGVFIEYSSNVDIAELYEVKLKFETKFSKYFALEKKKLITNDKSKIKSEIDKINKQHKSIEFEDSFLLLKVYIEFFELFEIEEREKILLIDFPGLGVLKKNNFFKSEILGPLINQSDSFLFFNPEVINSDENQKIIIDIVGKIRNRKVSFSYNNCLFIMNKWDKHRKDNTSYTVDKAKNDLENIFSNNELNEVFSDIDIINCSARDYKAFLNKKNEILNFEKNFNKLKSNFEKSNEDKKHTDDYDKNIDFYKYIMKDLSKKIGELDGTLNKSNNQFENNDEIFLQKLNNFLNQNNYKFSDIYKSEIIKSYSYLVSNINNHKLMIQSNKKKLDEKIKSHLKSSLTNMDNIIKTKGINFLLNINDTISFVLDKLNSPKSNNFKYSKIQASTKNEKEINEMFEQHKALINITIDKNIEEQNILIIDYIKNINDIFNNRKKIYKNLQNRQILGQIENEHLDILKDIKKKFYQSMENDFKTFINEVKIKINDIKFDLDIGEKNFQQSYFETSEVTNIRPVKNLKTSFFKIIMNIAEFLRIRNWPEYILHKYILFDDQETIINKSIENFKLVKEQIKENLNDYLEVYYEKLKDFEDMVKSEVQKMIDLSYSDFTKFKEDSKNIIEKSSIEFNEYIKNKYKDN